MLSFQIEIFSHQLPFLCKNYLHALLNIICGLGGSWGISWGALCHLVFKQEELQHRVSVLHDGLFYSFLQQVSFSLNLCVFLPCHCVHGGLQEPQAHQHRGLLGRKESGAIRKPVRYRVDSIRWHLLFICKYCIFNVAYSLAYAWSLSRMVE